MLFFRSVVYDYFCFTMVTLWLTIIIFFLVIHYIQFKLRRRKFEEMIEKFAGPPAIPVLGNLQIFLATSKGK